MASSSFGWMRRGGRRTVLLTHCWARLQSGVTMGFVIVWNDDRREHFLRNLKPSSSGVVPWCLIPLWFILMCSCADVPITLKDFRGGLSVSARKDVRGISYSLILCKERRPPASWEKRSNGRSSEHQPGKKQKHICAENRSKNETWANSKLQGALTGQ